MTYRIREVDGEDEDIADTLHELHTLCFLGEAPTVKYDHGYWWLAYCDKKPVAFAGITPSQLGFNTGYLKRVGVLPAHRGRGLHARLTRVRESKAKRLGWSRIVTDTTDNPASANNLFKAGYKMYTPKYGGWAFDRSLYWTKTIQ